MLYFKPYKYIKSSGSVQKRSLLSAKAFKTSIAVLLTISGLGVGIAKVIKPYTHSLISYAVQKPAFSPVLGYKTGVDTNFSFEELEKYNRPTITVNKNVPEKFYLTIPKLGIYEAEVKTNDTSLNPDKMLGHYTGTALPGESSNSFIYGHAVFEEYFDPLDYRKIFSTLPTLTPGDIFYIKYLDKTFKYTITMKKTLDPKDVNPYENFYPDNPNNSTASLMTCVPPGRKDFRLIVVGSLVRQGN